MTKLDWDKVRQQRLGLQRDPQSDDPRKMRRYRKGPVPDPPPISRANLPATEKQRKYVAALARKAGVPAPVLTTRRSASDAVGWLKTLT